MDILRGRQKEADRGAAVQQQQPTQAPKQTRSYSVPKVAPPKYYTYRADPMRLVSISEIKDPVVTGAIEPVESAGEAENAEVASLDTGTASDALAQETSVAIAHDDPRQYLTDAKVRANDDIASALEQYYSNGGALIWVSDGEITPAAKNALKVLSNAAEYGLDPADYQVEEPDLTMAEDDAAREKALMQFELVLSAEALSYMQDAKRGRVDPNRISEFHDLQRTPVDLSAAIEGLEASDDVTAFMEDYNPKSERFAELKTALAKIRNSDEYVEPIVFSPGTYMHPGEDEAELPKVVKAIWRKSPSEFRYDHSDFFANYNGETSYTGDAVELVKDFQRSQGLYVDGVIGPKTISAFDVETNADKVEKLVTSMERLRWLPDDFGPRYVFINQPAYRAYYHDDNGESFDMGVVVGNPTNQTYFFRDEIETVEFNPYWGVPRSIIINEYLPKLRANPSYLDQRGFEVSYNGRQVSSASVNWASAPMVDVRQKPGPSNALGQLKILFPNDHAIYMHDTPQKKYFERDERALSHGCIRLSDPKKMAAAVLGVPEADIDAEIATGVNTPVEVPQQFPVYVSYFTAWPDANGEIQYYDDVYDRDMYLERAFDAESDARQS